MLALQAIQQVAEEQKESVTRTAKMRTLGNIRLIAELFKKSVVPEKIVHMCIQDLTGDAKQEPSENNVEVRRNVQNTLDPGCVLFCSA